ncbi:MAG: hypothetical protein ACXAEL_06715 [Candidatus Hodarchaeales archaeon]|jgi:hypothetical protein
MTLEDMRSRVEVMRAYSQDLAKKKKGYIWRTIFISILIPVVVVILVATLFAIFDWLY